MRAPCLPITARRPLICGSGSTAVRRARAHTHTLLPQQFACRSQCVRSRGIRSHPARAPAAALFLTMVLPNACQALPPNRQRALNEKRTREEALACTRQPATRVATCRALIIAYERRPPGADRPLTTGPASSAETQRKGAPTPPSPRASESLPLYTASRARRRRGRQRYCCMANRSRHVNGAVAADARRGYR